MAPEFMSYVQW